MDPAHYWLGLAFTAMNAIRMFFYVPQIVAVARSTDGARDIALCTWWRAPRRIKIPNDRRGTEPAQPVPVLEPP